MIDIFGLCGSDSSASAALQSSLASRLQMAMESLGSTLYVLTWKERATPSGRLICALRASARRTDDSAFTSWPTPKASDSLRGGCLNRNFQDTTEGGRSNLCDRAMLAAWPTPTCNDSKGSAYTYSGGNHDKPALKLPGAPLLAGWATPAAKEAGGTPEGFRARKEAARARGAELGVSLTSLSLQVQLASWATPTARDHKSDRSRKTDSEQYGSKGRPLARQALLAASGPTPTGSTARTKSGGQLNPAHSRWLQGLPPVWDEHAPTATRSTRKSPSPSSARRSKRSKKKQHSA